MIRFLVNLVTFMVAAAIGILVADIALDSMSVEYPKSFLAASLLFGVISAVLEPILRRFSRGSAEMLAGGAGLFSAIIAMGLTSLIVGGLNLDGIGTWLAAGVIVWLAAMAAGFILRITVAKRFVERVRD